MSSYVLITSFSILTKILFCKASELPKFNKNKKNCYKSFSEINHYLLIEGVSISPNGISVILNIKEFSVSSSESHKILSVN